MPWYLKYCFDNYGKSDERWYLLRGVENSLSARDAAIEAAWEEFGKKPSNKVSEPELVWCEPLPKKEE